MKRVTEIKKQTDNRFLNMYELTSVHRDGSTSPYFMASRNSDPETLKLRCEEKPADAVMIVALKDGKMVLEKQYRYPLDDYIYEFPAGLCEKGEDLLETAGWKQPEGARIFMLTKVVVFNDVPLTYRERIAISVTERFVHSAVGTDMDIHGPAEGILGKTRAHLPTAAHTGSVFVAAFKTLLPQTPGEL